MATTLTTITAPPSMAPSPAISRDGAGPSRAGSSSATAQSGNTPIGTLGNLTPQQNTKLKQLWRIVLQYWDPTTTAPDVDTVSIASTSQTTRSTRQRMMALTRSQGASPSKRIVIPPHLLMTLKDLGATSGDIRVCRAFLGKIPCEQVYPAFLAMLKQENPDALLLRMLRTEKWNVPKAWVALLYALNWRSNTYKVDDLMMRGEDFAFAKSRMIEECADKKYGEGFMLQLTTGKGHLHGIDRYNRPIFIARARCHHLGEQPAKVIQDYVVFCLENMRLVMTPPAETVLVIFDMASFSITNWDFPAVKCIIDCFQDKYPGLLGHVLFYNAPKIFSGFWKIIQGVLSPELAEKVQFVRGVKHLEHFVPRDCILREFNGEEDWTWQYINPFPNENHRLRDTVTRNRLLDERRSIADYLFCLTTEWVAASKDESLKYHRDIAIKRLHDNYWALDPYIRARNISDRTGVIQEGGKIDYYPWSEKLIRAKAKPKVLAWHMDGMNLSTVTTINGRKV